MNTLINTMGGLIVAASSLLGLGGGVEQVITQAEPSPSVEIGFTERAPNNLGVGVATPASGGGSDSCVLTFAASSITEGSNTSVIIDVTRNYSNNNEVLYRCAKDAGSCTSGAATVVTGLPSGDTTVDAEASGLAAGTYVYWAEYHALRNHTGTSCSGSGKDETCTSWSHVDNFFYDCRNTLTVAPAAPPPTVSIVACDIGGTGCTGGTKNITEGDNVQMTWTSTGATSCSAIMGAGLATGGAAAGTDLSITEPAAVSSATYEISCTGPGGTTADGVTVSTAAAPPAPACSDGIDNSDPEDTLIDMADPGCSGPADTSERDYPDLITASVSGTNIQLGQTAILGGTVTNDGTAIFTGLWNVRFNVREPNLNIVRPGDPGAGGLLVSGRTEDLSPYQGNFPAVAGTGWVPTQLGTHEVRFKVISPSDPEIPDTNNWSAWVPFEVSAAGPPTADLKIIVNGNAPSDNGQTVLGTDTVSLEWSSTNAVSCTASGLHGFDTGGDTDGTDSTLSLSAGQNATFAIDCDGATDSIQVGVVSLPLPDITAANTEPADSSTFSDIENITFRGLTTVNDASMGNGNPTWYGALAVRLNQPNCAALPAPVVGNYIDQSPPWGGSSMGSTRNHFYSANASTFGVGTHCFSHVGDSTETRMESNENNNWSPWWEFTISPLTECNDGIDNGGVGGADEADDDCKPGGVYDPTIDEEDPPLNPPVVDLTASPNPVEDGNNVTLTWNFNGGGSPTSCNTTGGGSTSWGAFNTGLSNGFTSIGPLSSSDSPIVFGLDCSNVDGPGSDSVSVTINAPPSGASCGEPLLESDQYIVRAGDTIVLEAVNSFENTTCTISGGGITPLTTTDTGTCDPQFFPDVEITNTSVIQIECVIPPGSGPLIPTINILVTPGDEEL